MTNIEDYVVRQLRTVVPVLWGSLVSFIMQFVALDLIDPVYAALSAQPVQFAVTAVVIWLWYWVWSRVSHHVPDWLVRLVLGSEKEPTYE